MNFTQTNHTISVDYTGIKFLLHYLAEYLPYTFLSGLAVFVGIVGNLLITGAILVTKELQSTSNLIVFNLAVADILISLIVDTFTLVGLFEGAEYFYDKPSLCIFVGFFCLVACESSLMSIGLVAFNRYIKICHFSLYNSWFTKKKNINLLYYMLGNWRFD